MSRQQEGADGWRKSTRSPNVDCVEVRFETRCVHVRDSKNRQGPELTFTHPEWLAFLAGVRDGEFDVPAAPSTGGEMAS